VTDGCASFPQFVDRLRAELQAVRPFQSELSVTAASDVVLDSWRGARCWAMSEALSQSAVTVADYYEKGGEYLKEHCASNLYPTTHWLKLDPVWCPDTVTDYYEKGGKYLKEHCASNLFPITQWLIDWCIVLSVEVFVIVLSSPTSCVHGSNSFTGHKIQDFPGPV